MHVSIWLFAFNQISFGIYNRALSAAQTKEQLSPQPRFSFLLDITKICGSYYVWLTRMQFVPGFTFQIRNDLP